MWFYLAKFSFEQFIATMLGLIHLKRHRVKLIIVIAVLVHWMYGIAYKGLIRGRPKIHRKESDKLMQSILAKCPSLTQRFIPTFWAHGSYSQLFVLVLHQYLQKKANFNSHTLETSDGGEVQCDFYTESNSKLPDDAPICVFMHVINLFI